MALIFVAWFDATAAVQLENFAQYEELAPPSAASKNGSTVTVWPAATC